MPPTTACGRWKLEAAKGNGKNLTVPWSLLAVVWLSLSLSSLKQKVLTRLLGAQSAATSPNHVDLRDGFLVKGESDLQL
jgi:hypothetical protein